MFAYLFVAFLFILMDGLGVKLTKATRNILLGYIAIFLCAGYMCGSDWRGYELEYGTFDPLLSLEEPGYHLISSFAYNIGLGFWPFMILLKFLCLTIFYNFLKKFSDNRDQYIIYLFFFSFYGIYLFIDAPIRNVCAITLFLLGLLLQERHPICPWLFTFLAVFFHVSAIIGVLFLLIQKLNIKTIVYVIAYIVAIYISINSNIITDSVGNTIVGQYLFAEKIDRYIDQGFGQESMTSSAFSLGELLKIVLFFIVVRYRDGIEKLNHGRFIFAGAMLFFIIAKMGAGLDVLMRFGCYFSVFYALVMVNVARVFAIKLRKTFRICVILLALFQTYATVTFDYRFVPYTNYIVYVVLHDQLPSFDQRSKYNHTHSPYKK